MTFHIMCPRNVNCHLLIFISSVLLALFLELHSCSHVRFIVLSTYFSLLLHVSSSVRGILSIHCHIGGLVLHTTPLRVYKFLLITVCTIDFAWYIYLQYFPNVHHKYDPSKFNFLLLQLVGMSSVAYIKDQFELL